MASDESWRNGGTRRYQAPELIKGDPYDTKIDMFSFGVALFAMLYGRFPFEHEDIDNDEVDLVFPI